MQMRLSMTEDEIKTAIVSYVASVYGVTIKKDHLHIEVKSKQNYKSEWEQAAIRIECPVTAEAI
jgi:hypothetical protein